MKSLKAWAKKIRNAYFAKNITANKVMECYQKNLKEANAFSCFGWTVSEMIRYEKETHNPITKKMLNSLLRSMMKEGTRVPVKTN